MKNRLMCAVFAIFALAGPALAQASGGTSSGTGGAVGQAAPMMSKIRHFFTGIGDPVSTYLLNSMFGPIFAGATQKTVLSVIAGPINFVIVVLAALLIIYNFVWGAASTAHEGELMGRRTHSFWAPVRMALAAMLLIPLPAVGGYSTGQLLVAWLVKGSTATATYIWQTAAQAVLNGDVTVAGAITPAIPQETAHALWNLRVCMEAMAQMSGQATGGDTQIWASGGFGPYTPDALASSGYGTKGFESSVTTGGGATQRYYTSVPKEGGVRRNFAICGAIATPEVPSDIPTGKSLDFIQAHRKAIDSILKAYNQPAQNLVKAIIQNKPDNTFKSTYMSSPIDAANKQLTTDINAILPDKNQRNQAVADYLTGKNCASGGADKPLQNLTSACMGSSWMGAGGYYLAMARESQRTIDILTAAPSIAAKPTYVSTTASLGANSSTQADLADKYALMAQKADEDWTSAFGVSSPVSGESVVASNSGAAKTGLGGVGSWLYDQTVGRVETAVTENVAYLKRKTLEIVTWFTSTNSEPLVRVVFLGQWISTGIAIGIAGLMVMALFTGGVSNWINTLYVPLGISAFIGFVLPLLPYIYWIIAVTGYIIIVAEAVFSVAIWAVAHIRTEGEGIAGSAQAGYMILLSLTLTPVLMIVGFFVGMATIAIGGTLVNLTVGSALTALPVQPLMFLVAVAFTLAAFAYLYWMLIEKSFVLVGEFPSRILRWIGHNEAPLTRGEEREARLALVGTSYAQGRAVLSMIPRKPSPKGSPDAGVIAQ